MRIPFVSIVLGSLQLAGCQAGPEYPTIRLLEDEIAMAAEVVQQIPVGTDIQRAQAIMEANGFECSHYATDGEQYLYCCCDQMKGNSLFVGGRWQIFLDCEDAVVKGVRTTYGLVGP